MIKIVNTGNNPSSTGSHKYDIFINNKKITSFRHKREEGLATCLAKASKAVKQVEIDNLIDTYVQVLGEEQ